MVMPDDGTANWVHNALESVDISVQNDQWDDRIIIGVSGLLQALLCYDARPKMAHIRLLLQALSIPGDISEHAARLFLRDNILVWFQDDELRPILQTAAVWSSIARVAVELEDPSFTKQCIRMGRTVASMPDWQLYFEQELYSWITTFFRAEEWDLADCYSSVLFKIWNPDTGDYGFDDDGENALGLTFVALSKAWKDFDFDSSESTNKAVSLLRSTSWAALRREYPVTRDEWPGFKYVAIAPRFELAFSVPLRDSLALAATSARDKIREDGPEEDNGALGSVVKMMEDVASKIPKPLFPDEDEMYLWKNLRLQWDRDISAFGK
ncbi:hypothetical protein B0H19DRAFT_1133233 [Mycena capillaripes]|nr:hypothetical protein B0H19DRAFT_1133233 [Mycena capillaripes]